MSRIEPISMSVELQLPVDAVGVDLRAVHAVDNASGVVSDDATCHALSGDFTVGRAAVDLAVRPVFADDAACRGLRADVSGEGAAQDEAVVLSDDSADILTLPAGGHDSADVYVLDRRALGDTAEQPRRGVSVVYDKPAYCVLPAVKAPREIRYRLEIHPGK